MDYLKENLVDYIFAALETAKKTKSMLPQLPKDTKPVYIRVLRAISKIRDDNGYTRITHINKALQFSLPNTTKYINEMLCLGLVEKSNHPSDMRVVLIHLTELGEQYLEKYVTTYHNHLHEEFEKIGEDNCILMIETINKVYDAVKRVYQ